MQKEMSNKAIKASKTKTEPSEQEDSLNDLELVWVFLQNNTRVDWVVLQKWYNKVTREQYEKLKSFL